MEKRFLSSRFEYFLDIFCADAIAQTEVCFRNALLFNDLRPKHLVNVNQELWHFFSAFRRFACDYSNSNTPSRNGVKLRRSEGSQCHWPLSGPLTLLAVAVLLPFFYRAVRRLLSLFRTPWQH